jgi:thiamine pyrophosphate-dependent acetolactate synthase large subunit-like protein
MTNKKTYEVLAEAFMQEEVGTCFALLGDANLAWAAHMADLGCQFVYVRHEHCAIAAAMSYARKTNSVGVATVTNGPGLTQVMTALTAAVRAHIPLVIFAGESPLRANWYNQLVDQAPFVTACGAAYHALHHLDIMPPQVRDAFVQARSERRPVVLGVPFDLQACDWPGPDSLPAPSHQIIPDLGPMLPHPADIERAAALVAGAKRIVVMAGLGAVSSGAGAKCRALAERCGGLLATTLPARGLFHEDPFDLSVAGSFSSELARECFAETDLIIAVGASLAKHNADGGHLHPAAKVLQIDTSPSAISQGLVAAHCLVRADAVEGVSALIEALGPRPSDAPSWRSPELAARIQETPADSAELPESTGLFDPRQVVKALDAALPRDWEMVNSSGHCSFFFAQMRGRPADRFFTLREFGAIGNGTSFAMGVAAARPDAKVVLLDGDGSLLMHVQELETIVRHNMNILICVMNDGAYGSEIHKLRAKGLTVDGTIFGHHDLGRIAQGFGLDGRVINDLGDLPALVERFAQSDGAAIWDFHVSDQVVSPVMQRAHPKNSARKA